MRELRFRTLSVALVFALCLMSAGTLPAAGAASSTSDPSGERPIVSLDSEVSGEAAIRALGPNLAAVASAHGKSARELARALRDDTSLHVDKRGRIFYKEEALPAPLNAATPLADPSPWTESVVPLSDTFSLHSKQGAKRTIYLDFDGHVLTGTAWNTGSVPAVLDCPAWDIDGNPAVFGDTERARIQSIWRRVAEDYAPFDVDVTTQAPAEDALTRSSATDEYFGMRVLISPISSYFGGSGGIAYLGSFNLTTESYKPALVFPEKLSNSDRYIGECVTHESGHTLGLMHDGTSAGAEYYTGEGSGSTGWAPIMGVGYYQALTQWSKGEYSLANNQEDDLQVIQVNGCPLRADDYPDTSADAPRLPAGSSISAAGIVSTSGDADTLSFSCGEGLASIDVRPSSIGANLDVSLELKATDGSVIASSNPVDQLPAGISTNLSAGTYYLVVRGTGKAEGFGSTYSNYGSLGAWNLTGSVVAPTNSAPVALLSTSASSGMAPALFQMSAEGSYDPDGTSLQYSWDFGDGSTGSGSLVTHTYAAPGVYSAVLTATDATGLSSSAYATLSVVSPNVAPVAVLKTSGGGTAPAVITFDGSGSTDSDGSIVKWDWDFGDGTQGTGATVAHTYAASGSYTARLDVTDDRGAISSAEYTFTVLEAATPVMHISSLSLAITTTRAGKTARATVKIVDRDGSPVPGASVKGVWSGLATGTSSGITGTDGTVTLLSKAFKKSGTIKISITSVAKSGWSYDTAANTATVAAMSAAARRR